MCHSYDNATPLSFRLQVTEDFFFKSLIFFLYGKMAGFRNIQVNVETLKKVKFHEVKLLKFKFSVTWSWKDKGMASTQE